ncbi:uncharacterized protein LOC117325125 [Pecten maximus]|uniref:uncharacterized protein LOC117325125 n=1 Tax=Pecten maximus TaxID=6579 RepID=UPI001457FDC8|nr:uncharacterized protein LOC117325125 [Pecten maximus]
MDCRNHVCEQTAGTCAGCTPGKYGFTCEETCPACCPGKRCLQADGMCEDLPITGSKEDCLVVKVVFPVLLAFVTALCLLIVIRIKQKYSPISRLAKRKEPFSADNTTMEMDQHNVYSNAGVVMD